MNDTVRPQSVVWKGEIEFRGSPEEFAQFAESLVAAGVNFNLGTDRIVPTLIKRGYIAPVFLEAAKSWAKLTEGKSQRIAIKHIPGGIRTPHVHVGQEIVLMDRDRFKDVLGDVAREMFEQRALEKEDFYDAIAPLTAAEG
jgi:hypothetical protein